MKTILNGDATTIRLVGTQPLEVKTYRLMRYVLQAECAYGMLLHNVVTGKLVLLNEDEKPLVAALPAPVEQIALADAAELVEAYFLVPMDFDDKEFVDTLRASHQFATATKGINKYTILTTTCCNARCFYCYQADYEHVSLSEQTANDLVAFMLACKGDGPLMLTWFGGEPLVRMDRIDYICALLAEHGVEYKSIMVSNGYLFTKNVVARAADTWHLGVAQITLDGTEDVYNRTKAYLDDCPSPYQRVLNNIELLLKAGVRVSIRLNLGAHNADDLKALVDELHGRFGNRKDVYIYVHVLFDSAQGNNEAIRELHERERELTRRIQSFKGIPHGVVPPWLNTRMCIADDPNALIVYPNGHLFKCDRTTDGDEFGSLGLGITNWENVKKYTKTLQRAECNSCPLYPSCVNLTKCPSVEQNINEYICKDKLEDVLAGMRHCAKNYHKSR